MCMENVFTGPIPGQVNTVECTKLYGLLSALSFTSRQTLLYCTIVQMRFSQFAFPLPNCSSTWSFQINFPFPSKLYIHSHKRTDISATRNKLTQWRYYSTVKRARVFRARQTWVHIVGLPLTSSITQENDFDWLQWFVYAKLTGPW